jgi:cellulose biosynthesis protein BcsQ
MKIDVRRLLRSVGADWDRVLPDTDGKVVPLTRPETAASDDSGVAAAA